MMVTDTAVHEETSRCSGLTREQIERRVRELGPWFHDLDLCGVRTAPDHFLCDYPNVKWQKFAHAVPQDLRGMSVLDIGCNAGFYTIQMKRRGADRVVGIDSDERYLEQARFAAEVSGYSDSVEFRKLSVYDVGALGERFDLVLFLGVLYHLRHPLLALDLIHDNVARDWLIFQSMQRGSRDVENPEPNYDFWRTDIFDRAGWPKLSFVEHKYANDETNWWIPNAACAEAMLRASGFEIVEHPEDEVYVCRRRDLAPAPEGPRAVYPRQERMKDEG